MIKNLKFYLTSATLSSLVKTVAVFGNPDNYSMITDVKARKILTNCIPRIKTLLMVRTNIMYKNVTSLICLAIFAY